LKRKRLEKGEELMVNVENLLERLTERATEEERKKARIARLMTEPRRVMRRVIRFRPTTVYEKMLSDWRREKKRLLRRAREA